MPLIDLTGQVFGSLEVKGRAPSESRNARWICECQKCGKQREVLGISLKRGYCSCECSPKRRGRPKDKRRKGLSSELVRYRLKMGWTEHDAKWLPVGQKRGPKPKGAK